VTVTINGTNDVPVVTNNAAAAVGSVTEAGNEDNGAVVLGTAIATGTLTSSDADAGATKAWSVVDANPNTTYGVFAVNANTGVWTYTLDNAKTATQLLKEGESVNVNYTVRVTDDKGAYADQTVTVTINGTNDVPVINAVTAPVTIFDDANNETVFATLTGTITASDMDGTIAGYSIETNAATHATALTKLGNYGTLTLTGNTYTYVPDPVKINAIPVGTNPSDSFTLVATDDKDAWTTQTLTINITGTKDLPVLKVYTSYPATVAENGTDAISTNKTAVVYTTVTDAESTPTYRVTGGYEVVGWTQTAPGATTYTRTGNFGIATLNTSNGNISYVFNDTFKESEALSVGKTDADRFFVSVTDGLATVTKMASFGVVGADDALQWKSLTPPAVTLYQLGNNRAVIRIEDVATDADSLINYSATLSGAGASTATLQSVAGALVGLINLDGLASGGGYNLTLRATSANNSSDYKDAVSANNFVSLFSSVNIVANLNTGLVDLAVGTNNNDYLLGSSLPSGLNPDGVSYWPTFLGGSGNDMLDGLTGGMAFSGGKDMDTAVLHTSEVQLSDATGSSRVHYVMSMVPIAQIQDKANYFELSQDFVDAVKSSSSYSGAQSALLAIKTSTGWAYTDAETLVVATTASTTAANASFTNASDVFVLGADADNGGRLQLRLSDAGVRLVAGGASDDILGGAGNDVIVGMGNGNGATVAGEALVADILSGGNGNDVLAGGAKLFQSGVAHKSLDVSFLYGGQGDDVLVAVSGTVNATGGTGRDVFALFSDSESLNLVIRDFDASNDRIDLSALSALKSLVDVENAASLDQVQALKDLLNSAVTSANGDITIKLDNYLSPAAQNAGLLAEIKIEAAGATNGHISTQNLVFSEQSWSPYHWRDDLNPLV